MMDGLGWTGVAMGKGNKRIGNRELTSWRVGYESGLMDDCMNMLCYLY